MVGSVFCFPWEISLLSWLQSFSSGLLTALAAVFSMLGEEYLVILILGMCYWSIDKAMGRKVALSLMGATLFGSLIKGAALRRRPYMDNPEVQCLRPAHTDADPMLVTAQGYSLPSLHAAMSTSVYGTLAAVTKKKLLRVLAVLLPLLVGWSRMYLGVHYPTDVLCGWLLGLVTLWVMLAVEKKWGWKTGFAAQLLIGAVGFFYCRDEEFFSLYGIAIGLFGGFLYEEKRVRFEKPGSRLAFLLRPIGGIAAFVLVNALLKLPVTLLFEGASAGFLLIYRLLRYMVNAFLIIGLYPRLFRKLPFLR